MISRMTSLGNSEISDAVYSSSVEKRRECCQTEGRARGSSEVSFFSPSPGSSSPPLIVTRRELSSMDMLSKEGVVMDTTHMQRSILTANPGVISIGLETKIK